jgi:Excalibur calcium-binding domain
MGRLKCLEQTKNKMKSMLGHGLRRLPSRTRRVASSQLGFNDLRAIHWAAAAPISRISLANQNRPSGLAPFAWVAGIAFVLGRCSVDAPPDATAPAARIADLPETAAPGQTSPSEMRVPRSDTVSPIDEPAPTQREPLQLRDMSDDVDYPNCSAARAAGAAPIREGEAGYAPKLDRDRDGIACE